MRNAVGEIDRAVDRIQHPATVRLDIAQHAFFSKDGDARIGRSQRLFDQLLTAHVQLELDVVLGGGIDSFGRAEILAHQFTDGPCRLDRAILRLVELFERIHRADGNICRLAGSVQTKARDSVCFWGRRLRAQPEALAREDATRHPLLTFKGTQGN